MNKALEQFVRSKLSIAVAKAISLLMLGSTVAGATDFQTLYSFNGGSDGAAPYAPMIQDSSGNFYGTTNLGGGASACSQGCGTVFKLSADGSTETVLHSFAGGSDGVFPNDLVMDSLGNLYGTTTNGGGTGCGGSGCGTVFKISSSGTESILYSFPGGTKGKWPNGGMVFDSAGNLYGTTNAGGTANTTVCFSDRCGVLFKVTSSGSESVVYSFCSQTNCTDGAQPLAGLRMDGSGNFFGTAELGGATGNDCSPYCGVVFKVTPTGSETVLHSFDFYDGETPETRLVEPEITFGGVYWGTANGGGDFESGIIYKITSDGHYTAVYTLSCSEYCVPDSGLSVYGTGRFAGTTYYGGGSGCGEGCGTVYTISSTGTYSLSYTFTGGADGGGPGALVLGEDGYLYGTTHDDGSNGHGTIFKIKP